MADGCAASAAVSPTLYGAQADGAAARAKMQNGEERQAFDDVASQLQVILPSLPPMTLPELSWEWRPPLSRVVVRPLRATCHVATTATLS